MIYLDNSIKRKSEQIDLAIKLNSKNKTKKAIKILNSLKKEYPKDLRIKGLLGSLFEKEKKYKKALENFESILLIDKDYELAILEKAICLFKLKRYKECKLFLQKSFKENKIHSEQFHLTFELISLCLLKLKKNKEAEKYFEKVLRIDPNCLTSLLNMGAIYSNNKKDFNKAVTYFKKVLKINPKHTSTLINLGVIYAKQQNFLNAIKYFEKALKENKNDIKILHNLFLAYLESKDYMKAYNILNRIMELDNKKDEKGFYYIKKAEILFELKRYKEALKACEIAIKKDPLHICPYSHKLEILFKLKRKDEASKFLEDSPLGEKKKKILRNILKELENESQE